MGAPRKPTPRTYRVPELLRDLVAVMRRVPALGSIWLRGRLPAATREKVIVAVAQVNACRMCEHAHTRMALEAGVTDAELAALERMDPADFDRRTWLTLAFARQRVSEDFSPMPDDEIGRSIAEDGLPSEPSMGATVEEVLGRQTMRDVEDVARVMTVANRIANTLDALFERARGRPIPGSRLADELLINVLFLPAAWLGTSVAAIRQRKSPLAVWRQARGYTGRVPVDS